MATYAVGDIQGCFTPLKALLESANFAAESDTLWICGDLINRGQESLASLRFAMSLPSCKMVLGNHDLHLLAIHHGVRAPSRKDTLSEIIEASDYERMIQWLLKQPLLHHDAGLKFTMVHAGIPPMWSLAEAMDRAAEVEACLRSKQKETFFANMYGDQPDQWRDDLQGSERLRLITNYFTRMRFCDASGRLDLQTKTAPETAPKGFKPWFSHANRSTRDDNILFGHWAALEGNTQSSTAIALDTGCVWGGSLSMLRLEDRKMFSVHCPVAPQT